MHCLMFKHMYDMKNTKNTQKPTSLWWDSVYIHILLGTPNGLIPTVSSASWRSACKRLFSACSSQTWQFSGMVWIVSIPPIGAQMSWMMALDETLKSFILMPQSAAPGQSKYFQPASCKTVRGRKLRLHKFTGWLGWKRNVDLKNLEECLNPSDPKSCTSALFASLSLMFWISSLQLSLYYFRSLEGFSLTL